MRVTLSHVMVSLSNHEWSTRSWQQYMQRKSYSPPKNFTIASAVPGGHTCG
jgi:hypothetical protein